MRTDARCRRTVLWPIAIAAATLLLLTGCGSDVLDNPYEKTNGTENADAAAKLRTLPSLEETETLMKSTVENLAGYATTLVPGMQWSWMNDRMGGGCARPYDGTDGEAVTLQNYVASTSIPDDVWPQVFEEARTAAAKLGANDLERFHDEPGNHEVRFHSTEGTSIHIGSRGAVIGSSTGCRLTQDKLTAVDSVVPTP